MMARGELARMMLAGLLLSLACFVVFAGDAPRLRIGTSGDYAPFSFLTTGDAEPRGFDITVVRAFAAGRGYTIEWVPFRWPELAADLAAGRFELAVGGITVQPERSANGRFSIPLARSGAMLLYRKAAFKGKRPTTLADFDRMERRIAVNRGGYLERVTRARFHRAEIIAISDNQAVRRALASAEVDAVVTDTFEAPRWREGLKAVESFGPWTSDLKAWWLTPSAGTLAGEIDTWLLAREADGSLAGWRRDAFGAGVWAATATPHAALLVTFEERLALMPWVAEHKRQRGQAIEDRAQEQRVIETSLRSIDSLAKAAAMPGPDHTKVTAFLQAVMDAAKAVQGSTLAGAASEGPVPDLQGVLRPALERMGEKLARLIIAVARTPAPADLVRSTEQVLRPYGIDSDLIARVASTLKALSGQVGIGSPAPR